MRSARKCRKVMYPPQELVFKPAGVPAYELKSINLSVDEFEAVRLADYENLDHQEAADKMEISRSTFTRLVSRARQKISKFLVECSSLEIRGGNFHFHRDILVCENCGARIHYKVGSQPSSCPECGSKNLNSLAEELGHGSCCVEYNQVETKSNKKKSNIEEK